MNLETQKKVIDYLFTFITDEKKRKMEQVLKERTKHITLALEDIYQPQNASAVVRSCDCFGIQDLHVIENHNKYSVNPDVVLGSAKWVNIHRYNEAKENNTILAINELKDAGYHVVATTPNRRAVKLEDFKVNQKVAVLIGTEKLGLSKTAIDMADSYLKIPTVGFTESLNLSVSAGVILSALTSKLKQSKVKWELSEAEIIQTKYFWAHKILKSADRLEKAFLETTV